MSQFYALMADNTVKRIHLDETIVDTVMAKFVNAGHILKPEGIEETEFDGNMIAREKENITYVKFSLPRGFKDIPDNQGDIPDFNISEKGEDIPKSIFYFDNGIFYFQIFNKKNMLQRKMVLHRIETGKKFTKFNEVAFVIEDKVHAIYERESEKLFFQNYQMANQIFSLAEFVIEATKEEITDFANNPNINADGDKLEKVANTKTRRLIKLLASSGNIETFMKKRNRANIASKFNVDIEIKDEKIVLPTKDIAKLNRVLEFLNEDIFKGAITDKIYRSNSKKPDTSQVVNK